MFEDLREYIEWLQSSDKLHKVNKKVSSDCEITEIVTRMIEKNGPTLLFENVDNNNIPVVANLFGSEEKVCDALGVENLDDLYSKSENLISLWTSKPSSMILCIVKPWLITKWEPLAINWKSKFFDLSTLFIKGESRS